MVIPYQANHLRIVRRSHEYQSVNHFRFGRSPGDLEPWDDWENEFEKLPLKNL